MGPPHSITDHVIHPRAVREGKKRRRRSINGNEELSMEMKVVDGNGNYGMNSNTWNEWEEITNPEPSQEATGSKPRMKQI